MRIGVATSVIFHVSLITVGIVGLSHVEKLQPIEVESIAVDLVPIEEFANIRAGTERSDVIETPAPAVVDTPDPAQIAEPTGNTQDNQVTPEEAPDASPAPTVQTAPEPVAPPVREIEPEPTPTPEPIPVPVADPVPDPVETPVEPEPQIVSEAVDPEPTQVAPKPIFKTASVDRARAEYKKTQAEVAKKEAEKAKKEKADKVADIINAEKSRGGTTGTGGQASAGKASGQAARLTQSELGALKAQMRACWNPTLAERSDGVQVRLLVTLSKNGRVSGTPQILTQITSPLLGLSARTAQRKVAACGPFKLPANKYERWKEIDVTLDASQG